LRPAHGFCQTMWSHSFSLLLNFQVFGSSHCYVLDTMHGTVVWWAQFIFWQVPNTQNFRVMSLKFKCDGLEKCAMAPTSIMEDQIKRIRQNGHVFLTTI
jgi:hypothetical protein